MPAVNQTLLIGPTGSGKSTALQRRYYELVRSGVRTDQILVLVTGAAAAAAWRRALALETAGPLEIHGYFGLVQRELTLFWADVQGAEPDLREWVRPQFLNVEVAHHLMRARVDEAAAAFTALKASLQRIAIQIVSNLSTVAAAASLTPAEAAERLTAAHGAGRNAALFQAVQGLLEGYRTECRRAGLLDYALALDLYQRRLLPLAHYQAHLRRRYRHLLVDDLDETAPAEQDFIAAIAAGMESAWLAFGPDGGHSGFMGARPELALARFGRVGRRQTLTGSHTCSPACFRLGDDLAATVREQAVTNRYGDVVEEWIHCELRSEMLEKAAEKAAALLARGVRPGAIAIVTPHVDAALTAVTQRRLDGVPVHNLSFSRRLLDEPLARAIVTLFALVHPQWEINLHAGAVAASLAVLLRLDAVRCALLGDAIAARRSELPDLDDAGLRRRVGFERAEAYAQLRAWVAEKRGREWPTDAFVQMAIAELLLPLLGELQPGEVYACQQLLLSAHRFRLAMEHFGPGAYGSHYIKMLTEGTVAAEPLQAYSVPAGHLLLATPFAYLSARCSSEYQLWLDISGSGWYPSDVKELANPHVLVPGWPPGEQWTDRRSRLVRQANAARTARALVRRCRHRLVLAECDLGAWGEEQQGGGLATAFGDLIREKGLHGGATP